MKKSILIALLVGFVAVAVCPGGAVAGSSARHRWEGAGIVLGTIGLLGILSSIDDGPDVTVRYGSPYPPSPYYYPGETWVPGHWEWVRVWVPGYWETRWVPGCRDRWGRWTPGRWDREYVGGRYERQRVQVR